ncbi:MAG TPA: SWIM zinc finger family protein [Blastocatellia bacterium]|nr:SWIM zinc finger family protein [Blastocatellia bacterium]
MPRRSRGGGWDDDWDDDWGYRGLYERRSAIEVKGGIKAQNKRGSFGESWWARRWIAVLESFDIGGRLQRGRSYARRGQVLSIDIEKGLVKAKVQGSRPTPYNIKIKVKILDNKDWQKLAQTLNSQVIFAAKLLAGEMPAEIEQVFKEAKLSLFPEKLRDLQTECSCPDWSNPCKHIAAAYYLLGEEFDRDPFLIFKLRGLSREELVGLLDVGESAQTGDQDIGSTDPDAISEPVTADLASFWQGGALSEDFFSQVHLPPVSASLLKRLGIFPFWRGSERIVDALDSVYQRAALRGLDLVLGQSSGPQPVLSEVESATITDGKRRNRTS